MRRKRDHLYFDDCPICKAQKLADEKGKNLTIQELMEAFKKAKERGGMVGGLIEEEN